MPNDMENIGHSTVCPKFYEDPDRRHQERVEVAAEHEGRVRTWCHNRGYELETFDDGELWRISGEGHMADWWPRPGRLRFDYDIDRPDLHCHGVDQLTQATAEYFDWAKALESVVMSHKDLHKVRGFVSGSIDRLREAKGWLKSARRLILANGKPKAIDKYRAVEKVAARLEAEITLLSEAQSKISDEQQVKRRLDDGIEGIDLPQ